MRKIKLPFVSRRKYENAKRNLKQMAEARQQLENAFVENQKKYLVACENFKALQTQCEENKTKVFECLDENEHELEDKRIITPNKKLNKLRKYCFIGISICAVIFLALLITGIATKINILSYLSIIPALGIGVIFYIFYRKTK